MKLKIFSNSTCGYPAFAAGFTQLPKQFIIIDYPKKQVALSYDIGLGSCNKVGEN